MTTPRLLLASLLAALLGTLATACSAGPEAPVAVVAPPGDGGGDPLPDPTRPPTPTPTPDPDPGPAVDVFGVELLYATKAGGEAWAGTGDLMSDPRFEPQNTVTPNGDGSWKVRSTKVRMQVKTSAGYDRAAIKTYDRGVLADQGYMQSPSDWKNVEMTGYFRVNASNDWTDNIDLYARGGHHTDADPCEGSSYKGQLTFDGRVRWAKESWQVSYDFWPYASGTSPSGRWVGFKAVQHNVDDGVRLELWIDADADGRGFVKVYETVDVGDRFGDSGHCGGASAAMALTWGGPLAVYRWDSATDTDFKWLSVREIE